MSNRLLLTVFKALFKDCKTITYNGSERSKVGMRKRAEVFDGLKWIFITKPVLVMLDLSKEFKN